MWRAGRGPRGGPSRYLRVGSASQHNIRVRTEEQAGVPLLVRWEVLEAASRGWGGRELGPPFDQGESPDPDPASIEMGREDRRATGTKGTAAGEPQRGRRARPIDLMGGESVGAGGGSKRGGLRWEGGGSSLRPCGWGAPTPEGGRGRRGGLGRPQTCGKRSELRAFPHPTLQGRQARPPRRYDSRLRRERRQKERSVPFHCNTLHPVPCVEAPIRNLYFLPPARSLARFSLPPFLLPPLPPFPPAHPPKPHVVVRPPASPVASSAGSPRARRRQPSRAAAHRRRQMMSGHGVHVVAAPAPAPAAPTQQRNSRPRTGLQASQPQGAPRRFSCDHPGCDKIYSRAEHLQRHQLNRKTLSQSPSVLAKPTRMDVYMLYIYIYIHTHTRTHARVSFAAIYVHLVPVLGCLPGLMR